MTQKNPEEIFTNLKNVQGLRPLLYLEEEHKKLFRKIEEQANIGVHTALQCQHTLLAVHNGDFRNPSSAITQKTQGKIFFPTVPFPEVQAKNVVSSSPSLFVHELLQKKLNISLKSEEATLLIGFDS